jgi:hypothetical protein
VSVDLFNTSAEQREKKKVEKSNTQRARNRFRFPWLDEHRRHQVFIERKNPRNCLFGGKKIILKCKSHGMARHTPLPPSSSRLLSFVFGSSIIYFVVSPLIAFATLALPPPPRQFKCESNAASIPSLLSKSELLMR